MFVARNIIFGSSGPLFNWQPLRDGMTPKSGAITFARASSGTVYDPVTGAVTLIAPNIGRIESDGLLIEPQRTNYFINSQNLAASWSTSVGASIGGTSSGGLTTMSSALHGANSASAIYQGLPSLTGTVCVSALSRNSSYRLSIGVNPSTQIYSPLLSIGSIAEYRELVYTTAGTIGNAGPFNRAAGNGFGDFGCLQVEIGAYRTSYIPTAASAATRSADVCTLTIPAGVSSILITYGDNTTATVSVTPGGTYVLPTTPKKYKSITSV